MQYIETKDVLFINSGFFWRRPNVNVYGDDTFVFTQCLFFVVWTSCKLRTILSKTDRYIFVYDGEIKFLSNKTTTIRMLLNKLTNKFVDRINDNIFERNFIEFYTKFFDSIPIKLELKIDFVNILIECHLICDTYKYIHRNVATIKWAKTHSTQTCCCQKKPKIYLSKVRKKNQVE